MRAIPSGWSTSSEAVTTARSTRNSEWLPVVEASEQGAGELGALYWREVERFMRGLVATNVNTDGSVQLRLRPGSLVLLAFGLPERTVADDGVRCKYPIVNGFLVRTAGGTISFRAR